MANLLQESILYDKSCAKHKLTHYKFYNKTNEGLPLKLDYHN